MLRSIVLFCCAPLVFAQTSEIEKILKDSEAAWNRGDLESFASYYEDSPETTFIGREVVHGGVQAILERYRRAYPTREAMGTLAFSEIAVRPLADGVALATGKFTLHRSTAGGGEASGRFTLILKRTPAGWRIIHDHTS
ncbi:MAG TPA: SgcJ/EcaC family oxidoreductase [Bryobacteraceae bacterium]|nr:SgcJ/EcaC family oxidoreductase [Bryobacteraceae bacterium]